MLYKVKVSDINVKNKHCPIGVNVLLNDDEIIGIEDFLEPVDKTKETKYIIPHHLEDLVSNDKIVNKVSSSKSLRSVTKKLKKKTKKK